jgi:hypothetical protein
LEKGNPKSQTKSRGDLLAFCLGLSLNLLTDVLQQAGLEPTRDCETLYSRASSEGLGFLTKTLPNFGKSINLALKGERLSIHGFRKLRGSAIPHFLKELLSRIFTEDGYVRENADICAITDVTQICFTFYKLEVPYDKRVTDKVLSKFVRIDQSLPENFDHLGSADTRLEPNVLREARSLITKTLRHFNPVDISPQHGPGAVATGEEPHEKWNFKRLYDHVEEVYPFLEYYMLSEKHRFDEWPLYWDLTHEKEATAKVVLVPKDSRGPRLISCEPLEVQYIQQGLGKKLVAHLERHPLTKGHVNFSDQGINRRLALEGSVDGRWATLDLSDASDRVSLALVTELFKESGLLPALLATRSQLTKLPTGDLVRMRKFAPMGSALCFPVEALCFWALAAACIHVYGQKTMSQALANVYVYGDDIIVREGYEQYLLQHFHYFGLRFGQSKCCYTGLFRESCGCDAYGGQVVTPIKVKQLPPNSPNDGTRFPSWIAIANGLFYKGYYRAADYVKKRVERVYGLVPYSGRDPHRANTESGWGLISGNDSPDALSFTDSAPAWYVRTLPDVLYPKRRWNNRFQRHEYHVRCVRPLSYTAKGNSDWRELLRHLQAGCGTDPHRYAFLRRVKLSRRWTCLAY